MIYSNSKQGSALYCVLHPLGNLKKFNKREEKNIKKNVNLKDLNAVNLYN